jgi:hypothetical protein
VTTWPDEIAAMARLARDLPAFLRPPLGLAEARRRVRQRLESRERDFLALAERAIFAAPHSPYRRLLAAAGCEPGDVRALLAREGLEGALQRLAGSGVYLTFDEFKGRRPVVRGSARFQCAPGDFDNPAAPAHVQARTGGSRGRPVSVRVSLPFLGELAASTAVMLDAHGLGGHDHALWLQGAFAGLLPALIYARLGRPPRSWHHPLPSIPLGGRLAVRWVCALSRALGCGIATPRYNDLHDVGALAARLARAGPTCVTGYASSAVRVAVAARESGLDLRDVCFVTMGEPFTAAKQRAVQAAGARAVPRYGVTEAGIVAYGCATPREPDDMHVLADCLAVVRRRRATPGGDVDALLFTSLRPSAPKVLLNVETGDYARLARRDCDCAMGAIGLRDHVLEVRSFEKLSGEGMSFVTLDLLRALEEALPARFGGTGGDYQLVEEEAEDGILRAVLLVSPRIGPVDDARVREALLEALGAAGGFDRVGAAIWRSAGTVQVRRQWPLPTTAGKVLPFHVARRQAGQQPASAGPS